MIALGSDHVGKELKDQIIQYLDELKMPWKDFGCDSTGRTDYPVYAKKVTDAIQTGVCDRGIIFCGTGIGISIAANKAEGIRAVVCSEPYSAKLSRAHNNTNILALGSRVVGVELAKMIVFEWLNTEFEGGRHQQRIQMIQDMEHHTTPETDNGHK